MKRRQKGAPLFLDVSHRRARLRRIWYSQFMASVLNMICQIVLIGYINIHPPASYRYEEPSLLQGLANAFQLPGYFAEPDDVRTQGASSAASRAWHLWCRVPRPGENLRAEHAADLIEFAVHVDKLLAASLLLEVVHVMRYQQEAPRPDFL